MAATLRIARSRARPAEYADALREAVQRLRQHKDDLALVQENVEAAQQEVLTIMAAAGIESSLVKIGDNKYRVTSVRGTRMDINESGLRKSLTATVYDKLCDLKLNRTKLEIAIAEGRVDPVVVASHTTKKDNKPFAKVTLVQGMEASGD